MTGIDYDERLHAGMASLERDRARDVPRDLAARLTRLGLAGDVLGKYRLTFKGEALLDEWDTRHGTHGGL